MKASYGMLWEYRLYTILGRNTSSSLNGLLVSVPTEQCSQHLYEQTFRALTTWLWTCVSGALMKEAQGLLAPSILMFFPVIILVQQRVFFFFFASPKIHNLEST